MLLSSKITIFIAQVSMIRSGFLQKKEYLFAPGCRILIIYEATPGRFCFNRVFCRASLLCFALCPPSGPFLYYLHYRSLFQGSLRGRIDAEAEVVDRFPLSPLYLGIFLDLRSNGGFGLLPRSSVGSIPVLDHEGGRSLDHHPRDPFHRTDQHPVSSDGETV